MARGPRIPVAPRPKIVIMGAALQGDVMNKVAKVTWAAVAGLVGIIVMSYLALG